ncbi:gamma-glutamyltransferase 1 [Tahibacter aquaticus]|uniref:Glutathione hydrolase proenzyme n=2 Tax=Tahibacter aquaticus TaxID=520092 RepID=A0A4R6YRH6_9GAMM|nr:gamma-glutamyltransferase [Tahibacter aquaticus]TDR40454.1 gamma-glutamyltransferase 1 [Tahibacter aquaticus]
MMQLRRYFLACVLVLALPVHAAEKPGKAAIASAHKLATEAGFEVLGMGGNAFDAAVAVSAALSVVEPQSSGIGGGAFFLLHRVSDGRQVMLDAREMAPGATDARQYLDAKGELDRDKSVNGPLAAGIPGEPAALVWMAEHYGKLPLKKSLAPAIRLARNGFAPDARSLMFLGLRKDVIARDPGASALFLPKGTVPVQGWVLKNPDLAKTLEIIADKGHAGFYSGEYATKLVDGVKKIGGNWSLDDLARYQVKEREPIVFQYRGHQVVTAPPPSSGGIALAEMLNILQGYDLSKIRGVERTHLVVEAMRRAYRDRAEYLGDPDFVKMPVAELISPLYAAGLRASIHPKKATPSDSLPGFMAPAQGTDTTHFSIIDADGNLVAATQTVNLPYGAAVVVPGTGFLLNNEMDDFALKAGVPNAYGLVGGDANAPRPYRRPLSSMTPTFVVGPERTLVIGTPGGSRIITMVLEGILAWFDGDAPQKLVDNKRYHHQFLPDVISIEKDTFSLDERKQLQQMGHTLSEGERPWGFMNAVDWNRQSGELRGGSDSRGVSGTALVK